MDKNAEIIVNILESMYFLKTINGDKNVEPLIYMSNRIQNIEYSFVRKTLIQEQIKYLAYGRKGYLDRNCFIGVIIPEKEKGFFYKKDFIENINEFLENLPLAFFNVHPEVIAISIVKSMV